jgi:hypothetical protein
VILLHDTETVHLLISHFQLYCWRDVRQKINPKDFTIENVSEGTVYRLPGTVNGQQFIIQNCQVWLRNVVCWLSGVLNSSLFVFDYTEVFCVCGLEMSNFCEPQKKCIRLSCNLWISICDHLDREKNCIEADVHFQAGLGAADLANDTKKYTQYSAVFWIQNVKGQQYIKEKNANFPYKVCAIVQIRLAVMRGGGPWSICCMNLLNRANCLWHLHFCACKCIRQILTQQLAR